MKHLLFPFLFPALLCAQSVDSTAIRQVDSLLQVSRDLTAKRDFDQALEVNTAAEKIALSRDLGMGPESAAYGSCCYNHGRVLHLKGDYPEAEKWYQESKAIREKALGKEHPDYVQSLNNLAYLYNVMGQHEKVEPLCIEAKIICEKKLGKEHPFYAGSLGNLADLYSVMGLYENAEPLRLEIKDIIEKALGKEHPSYAESLLKLAILYDNKGLYEKAEPLCFEAKNIREKVLGKEHPDYARSLSNLAGFYQRMGQYEKAELLCFEAKVMQEKVLGRVHHDYAHSLNELAGVYFALGLYEKAEPLCFEAKVIREKVLGKKHYVYAANLRNLAILYQRMGQHEKAEPLYGELSFADKHLIEKALLHLSEAELINYLSKFSRSQNQILSFTQLAGSKSLIPACYDNSLFYKGFLLNAASRIKRLALTDSTSTEKYNLLKSYQRRLATQYALPIAERDSAQVVELETKANDLEKDLTRTVAGFGEAMRQVNWQEVQAALKPEEAAIEFVHYRYYEKVVTDSTMYAALLLRPGDAEPFFIPLFEEKQLDSLMQSAGGGARRADYVNNLYTMPERGVKPLGKPQKSLYELLWQPLEDKLAATKTIYFSPSGLLHRLNLGAIPVNDEASLADRYQLVELSSTRSRVLGIVPAKIDAGAQDAALYGGIQYNMDSTAIAAANQGFSSDLVATRGELAFSYTDSTNRGGAWSYLKSTAKEADNIETILTSAGIKANVRKGYTATEESFKSLGKNSPSPRILHLATHGFFFPDLQATPGAETPSFRRGVGEVEPVFKISDHPMIRSGLILVGGNHAWKTGKPLRPDMEDGILTAYEISQVNLSNTELVVLSACETGLGDIQGNEGVYGLQRAFKIAGAKYLIMSLWQVPDQETSVFMTTFYQHWIAGKMSIPEAFRRTQREMRERFINPYQWAGFVLVE